MSILIDFLTNASSGFPVTADILNLMQQDYRRSEEAIVAAFGDAVIVTGMTWDGANITPGLFTWNGELIYFDGAGGPAVGTGGLPDTAAIQILDVNVAGVFCDTSTNLLYNTRTATHAAVAPSTLQYDDLVTVDSLKKLDGRVGVNEVDILNAEGRLDLLELDPDSNGLTFTDYATIATAAISGGITDLTLGADRMIIWKEPNGRITIQGELSVSSIDLDPTKADGLLFDITTANAIYTVPSGPRLYAADCYYFNSVNSVYVPLEAYMNKADGKVYFDQKSHGTTAVYVAGTIYFSMSFFGNTTSL